MSDTINFIDFAVMSTPGINVYVFPCTDTLYNDLLVHFIDFVFCDGYKIALKNGSNIYFRNSLYMHIDFLVISDTNTESIPELKSKYKHVTIEHIET